MSDLTDKFTALEAQLTTEHTETQSAIAEIQAALDLINAQLDTQTVNNAANTRYLLSALGTLNPCTDCEALGVVVPPTDTTGTTPGTNLCKRVQAFLHAMQQVYTVLDTMSAFGVGFSTAILTNAFSTVITALENGDTTPMPSFPEAVQIVGDGISYIASNAFIGHTLVGLFSPLYFDLLSPMYEAGDAAAIQSVYNGVVEGTDYSVFEARLLEHAAYNELYSYYFDAGSDPNLAGYDGTICSEDLACVNITVPSSTGTSNYSSGGSTYSRVAIGSISITSRITDDTTVHSATRMLASIGGITHIIETTETPTFGELHTAMGGYPIFIDSQVPESNMVVQFCELGPS